MSAPPTFSELNKYTSRFSPYKEDFKNCPNAFCDEEVIKKQIDIALGNLGIDVYSKQTLYSAATVTLPQNITIWLA